MIKIHFSSNSSCENVGVILVHTAASITCSDFMGSILVEIIYTKCFKKGGQSKIVLVSTDVYKLNGNVLHFITYIHWVFSILNCF